MNGANEEFANPVYRQKIVFLTECGREVSVFGLVVGGDARRFGAVHYSKRDSMKAFMPEWDRKFDEGLVANREVLAEFARLSAYDAVIAISSGRRYAAAFLDALYQDGMLDLSDHLGRKRELESGIEGVDKDEVRKNFVFDDTTKEDQYERLLIVDDVVDTGASFDGVLQALNNVLSPGAEIHCLCLHIPNPKTLSELSQSRRSSDDPLNTRP